MPIQEKLREWIFENIQTEGFRRYDDLHVDELCREYAQPETWLSAIEKILKELNGLKDNLPDGYCYCIGLSLESSEVPLGITFESKKQLVRYFTVTPPSIYVFKSGEEPWKVNTKISTVVPSKTGIVDNLNTQVIFVEFQNRYENNFLRSLWFVSS